MIIWHWLFNNNSLRVTCRPILPYSQCQILAKLLGLFTCVYIYTRPMLLWRHRPFCMHPEPLISRMPLPITRLFLPLAMVPPSSRSLTPAAEPHLYSTPRLSERRIRRKSRVWFLNVFTPMSHCSWELTQARRGSQRQRRCEGEEVRGRASPKQVFVCVFLIVDIKHKQTAQILH